MKKHLLFPVLFIALLFSGCQEADDDVDMPMPEKSVEEQIKGEWVLTNTEGDYYDEYGKPIGTGYFQDSIGTGYFQDYYLEMEWIMSSLYVFNGEKIEIILDESGHSTSWNNYYYKITRMDDASLIEFASFANPDYQQRCIITSITDSSMTWREELKNEEYCEDDHNGNCGYIIPLTIHTFTFKRK